MLPRISNISTINGGGVNFDQVIGVNFDQVIGVNFDQVIEITRFFLKIPSSIIYQFVSISLVFR